jgi:hypothetical protein
VRDACASERNAGVKSGHRRINIGYVHLGLLQLMLFDVIVQGAR